MIANTMAEFFATTARKDRGILFMDPVSQRERLWTYAEMHGDAERLASRLQGAGFRKRFLAVIWMEQSPACFRAFMSVMLAGGIPVPLHPANKPEETLSVIRQLEAEAVLLSSDNAAKIRSLSSDEPCGLLPLPYVCYLDGDTGEAIEDIGKSEPDGFPRRDYVPPEETAVVFMSSGSTGTPKGIMLSERNLLSNVSSIQSYLKLTDEDRVLVTKSFGYCSTITGEWLLALHAGAHIVMSQGFFHPLYAVSFIREHKATFMCAVPSMLLPLLKSSKWEHTDLLSLRQMIVVGGQMPPEMLLKLQQRLPWTTISPCYGLTEASPRVTYLPAGSLAAAKAGSVGIPVANVQVDIYREGKPAAIREIGEVVVRGPNVMLGYYNDRQRTNDVLSPYGLRTTDGGYIDEDGYLYLTGRLDNAINIAGHTLYPETVERCLTAHEAVEEAAVIGRADETWGQLPVAFVVLRESDIDARETENELNRYCQNHLSAVQRPHKIEIVRDLPKTRSGKLDRGRLTAIAKEMQDVNFIRSRNRA